MNQNLTQLCDQIFHQVIQDYHKKDHVDSAFINPYAEKTIEHQLYLKCWIDTVQWHLEDIIRNPAINPVEALEIKRRIDRSNQHRTDLVEQIDIYFLHQFSTIKPLPNATINTESPAWAIDRLSILYLKIYHMQKEVERTDSTPQHQQQCQQKLHILSNQHQDLTTAITQLLNDYSEGKKYIKTYVQMKMYNDPSLNPVLYKK